MTPRKKVTPPVSAEPPSDDNDVTTPDDTAADPGWVSRRKAADAAGVSVTTIRNWERRGEIESRLVDSPHGPMRVVNLAACVERTRIRPLPQVVPTSPGTSMIPFADLAPLLDRLNDAERRAIKAEMELEFLRQRMDAAPTSPPKRGWFKKR